MDPLSQGVLGASLPQSLTQDPQKVRLAFGIGFLSGMAPDLDVLIRSSVDPLLFLEFHRQFTHSLIFIPFGALICALAFYPFVKRKLSFKLTWGFSTLGYATHGLLDSCTSYGTQLLWPFSDYRVAWNNVSIIDPIFTLPILALVITAYLKHNPNFARVAFVYALIYLSFGVVQRERAEAAAEDLAATRDHIPQRLTVKPSFGNLLLWKSLYEHEGHYYIDAVRTGIHTKVIPGESVAKLSLDRDLPWLDPESVLALDVERFRWFSDDYIAMLPGRNDTIVDVRYSLIPNQLSPLWGIRLDRDLPDLHVDYVSLRHLNDERRKQFINMLF